MKRVLRRHLKLSPGGVDFTSNDYLGLARSEVLYEMISDAMAVLPQKRNGSTGSRLLSGNTELIESTERKLASLFNSESGLLFDSGYMANLAVLSTLPQRGDTIVMDELSHASIKDGAKLSLATKWNFRHNDIDDLEKKLGSANGHKWIVLESLYSMDGDECRLEDIIPVAKKFNASVILDEAHTTGLRKNSVHKDVDVHIYTFGKAMGIHGAFAATSNKVKDLLVNFSRPFIYTTAPSDHTVVSISCAFDFLGLNTVLRDDLRKRIDLFRSMAAGIKGWNGSNSQIQAVIVSGHDAVVAAAAKLQLAQFDVRPILSPTVKEGQERLRICLHTFNTEREIRDLVREMISLDL